MGGGHQRRRLALTRSGALTRASNFPGISAATNRKQETSTAAAGWCTRACEHSRARHLQPRLGGAPAEPGIGGADFASTGDQAAVCCFRPSCTRRTVDLKGCKRFALVERGELVLAIPWLIAYARREDTRTRYPAQKSSGETQHNHVASVSLRSTRQKNYSACPPGGGTLDQQRGDVGHPASHPETLPPSRWRQRQCWRVHP